MCQIDGDNKREKKMEIECAHTYMKTATLSEVSDHVTPKMPDAQGDEGQGWTGLDVHAGS